MPTLQTLNTVTISCQVTACHGHLPNQLIHENFLWEDFTHLPDFITVKNITHPSAFLLPPSQKNFKWQLINQLSLNFQHTLNKENFVQLLKTHDWSGKAENQKRIDGILSFTSNIFHQLVHGSIFQGNEYKINCQETAYASLADIYLFGTVLHQFFCLSSEINHLTITRIVCTPSNKEFLWKMN